MRKAIHAFCASIPFISAAESVSSEDLADRATRIYGNFQQGNKIKGTIGVVSAAIDAKKVKDGFEALGTYNEIKRKGVPTYVDADNAIEKSIPMLDALDGSEFSEPVRGTVRGVAIRSIDSANLQNCSYRDSACFERAGKAIDATTYAANHPHDGQWPSNGMVAKTVQQVLPETVNDSWNIFEAAGHWFEGKFPRQIDYVLRRVFPEYDRSKPECGSTEHYSQVGDSDCEGDEEPKFGGSKWKLTSFTLDGGEQDSPELNRQRQCHEIGANIQEITNYFMTVAAATHDERATCSFVDERYDGTTDSYFAQQCRMSDYPATTSLYHLKIDGERLYFSYEEDMRSWNAGIFRGEAQYQACE